MPRNARCILENVPYHVTQRGTNRQTVFYSAADRRGYLALVRDNLADAGVRVLAYCLMTNHVHWVVVPKREDSLATLFRRVHGRYAQALNTRRERSGHLWQNRFFSCPLSEERLWIALRYVEQNPVRAMLAASPERYEWSSARVHLTGERDRAQVLDMRYWADAGGMETWREMHATPEDVVSTYLLKRCTYAGRPFGSDEFLDRLEVKLGRKWRRWKVEQIGAGSDVA